MALTNAKEFDNGALGLYLIAGAVILFVLIQSIFFLVKAWKRGKELGISTRKLKESATSSALFTIPSALSVLATVVALTPALGLVIPWVRLSVIGNITYETFAATEAIGAFGVDTGISEQITDPAVYGGIAWVMTIGICFSLVLLPFLAKPLHKKFIKANQDAEKKAAEEAKKDTVEETVSESAPAKKKRSLAGFVDYVTPALFIGLIGAFVSNAILGGGVKPNPEKGVVNKPLDGSGVLSVLTLASAILVSVIFELIAKKFKLKWLEPFVMPIGMIAGMAVAVIAYQLLPEHIAMLEWRGY